MQYSKEEKAMWLDDWRQSGKSAWGYAKENGLNPQTFSKWTKTENENKQSFVEITSSSINMQVVKPVMNNMPEILIEKGDVKIHIPLLIGHMELRAVMEGLGAAL
jgi:transposase-like protein